MSPGQLWVQPVGDLIIARVRGEPTEVPNTKLAYLARLAFGDGDYRVFYSDMTTAIAWLAQSD